MYCYESPPPIRLPAIAGFALDYLPYQVLLPAIVGNPRAIPDYSMESAKTFITVFKSYCIDNVE